MSFELAKAMIKHGADIVEINYNGVYWSVDSIKKLHPYIYSFAIHSNIQKCIIDFSLITDIIIVNSNDSDDFLLLRNTIEHTLPIPEYYREHLPDILYKIKRI